RDRLAALCASPLGREAAQTLEPSTALDEVRLRQQATSEARWLADTAGGLPVQGIHDIREPVHRASIGGILAAQHLLDIRDTAAARMLQESLITPRGDRYTVPVRSEFRHQFPGIAHDQSSSGVTVFMEPLAVVPLGNRVRELAAAERDEVVRILAALSEAVGAAAGDLAITLEGLGAFDLAAAKARLSLEMRG